MKASDIQMRDPFVLPVAGEGRYYLFGTTDPDCWRGPGIGFDVYVGRGLDEWEGPFPAFRPESGFWGQKNFWAPEAHRYRGRYYLFASFIAEGRRRGTQALAADRPEGPYRPHSAAALTPAEWECLDGTLFVDEGGKPWLVFCHEWVQVGDGEVCALPLSEDLCEASGSPVLLFRGSEAPWTRPHRRRDRSVDPRSRVTDGPFLYRHSSGSLLMLWSSFSDSGYAIGIASSESGELAGPWVQDDRPLLDADAGHGMLFRSFEGSLYLALHSPNESPRERPIFIELAETARGLGLASTGRPS
jgi:arabinan endo-1,5-alpha-L-arabinosidase